MEAGIGRALAEFAAHPQPDPVAIGVLHAERVVDIVYLRGDQLIGDLEQIDIVRIHQRIDLAEGQEVAAVLQPQNGEHRLRPENPAARQIPVPQSATAAVERGIDASAHGVVDEVTLAGAGRLPMERKAEDQHHEAGGRGQRDRQRGVGAPDRIGLFLDDDHLAGQRPDGVPDRQRAIAIRQRNVDDAGRLPGWRGRHTALMMSRMPVESPIADFDRHAGENALVAACDDEVPPGGDGPGRNEARQQQLQTLE